MQSVFQTPQRSAANLFYHTPSGLTTEVFICNCKNEYVNLCATLNAIEDEHKREVMCNVIKLLATIDDVIFLDCIETFVITFTAD